MTPEPVASEPNPIQLDETRRSSSWDLRNATGNYIALALYQVAGALLSFSTAWMITNDLGSVGFGSVLAVVAASQTAQIFVNWTGSAVVRFGVDEFVDTGVIARAFWIRFAILLLNAVLIVVAAGVWLPPLADHLKVAPSTAWFVLVHFLVTVLAIHVQMGLQAAKLPRSLGMLQMAERGIVACGVLILWMTHRLDLVSALTCYVAGPAICAMVGFIHLRKLIFVRFALDLEFIRKVLLYSLPLLPFSLIGYFSGNYVDAVFIASLLSTQALGIYGIAAQMNGILLQFPTLVNSLMIPFFISLEKEGGRSRTDSFFTNGLPSLTLFAGLAATVVSVVGYIFIPVIFGSEFGAASLPFWILVSSSVVAIPVLCGYSALVHARSATYIAAIVALLSAIVNISMNLLLIPIYGPAGCAIATVLAYLVSLITFAALLNKRVSMPISWTPFAVLPHLASAAALAATGSVWTAVLVSIGSSGLLLWIKRSSVIEGVEILRRVVRI